MALDGRATVKSSEEIESQIQSALLLDRLAKKVDSENWCLLELGRSCGRSRRWIQRKLRGDTQLTISEFFLIAAAIGWNVDLLEVSK